MKMTRRVFCHGGSSRFGRETCRRDLDASTVHATSVRFSGHRTQNNLRHGRAHQKKFKKHQTRERERERAMELPNHVVINRSRCGFKLFDFEFPAPSVMHRQKLRRGDETDKNENVEYSLSSNDSVIKQNARHNQTNDNK